LVGFEISKPSLFFRKDKELRERGKGKMGIVDLFEIFQCPNCDKKVPVVYVDIVEIGPPVCNRCDIEMKLLSDRKGIEDTQFFPSDDCLQVRIMK